MDWYTSTDSDLALLEDATLDDYVDGIPDSYELTQWYGSQDYPLSTLDDAEMADLIDGRTPARVPWHCSLKLADTVTLKLPEMAQINVHGGNSL